MKNKNKNLSIIHTLCLLILFAGTNVCFAQPVTGEGVMPIKQVLIKFCIAMGSVFLSVLIIWVGLNIFKKVSPQRRIETEKEESYGENLENPKNIEDAIVSFIDKNRL